jgi:hypothetical protein
MNNVCDPWALKCQPSDPPIQDHPTPLFHSSRAIIGRWTLRWRSWQDFSTESFATCTKCTNRCILHTICMYVYNYIYMYVYSIYVHVHLYLHVHVHAHVHHLQVYIYIYLWKVMNIDHIFDIDISFAYSTRLRSKCHPKSPAHPENGTSNGTLIRAIKVCTQANRRWHHLSIHGELWWVIQLNELKWSFTCSQDFSSMLVESIGTWHHWPNSLICSPWSSCASLFCTLALCKHRMRYHLCRSTSCRAALPHFIRPKEALSVKSSDCACFHLGIGVWVKFLDSIHNDRSALDQPWSVWRASKLIKVFTNNIRTF